MKTPLSQAALARIYGHRLIKASGYDRSAILTYARAWMRREGGTWGAAQKRAWDLARGQMQIARAWDDGVRELRPQSFFEARLAA